MSDDYNNSEHSELPPEVDPDSISVGSADLLGILPIQATFSRNMVNELENRHDTILEELSDKNHGFAIGFDEEVWETLSKVRDLDPDDVDSIDSVSEDVAELLTPSVGPASHKDIGSVIKDVQDAIGESGKSNFKVTDKIPIGEDLSLSILSYFTFSSAIIEQRSAYLLRETLINENKKEEGGIVKFVDEQMSQHRREELLYDCGTIDGKLKNNLSRIRSFRNELVHDPTNRYLIDVIETEELISLALSSAKQLDQHLRSLLREQHT